MRYAEKPISEPATIIPTIARAIIKLRKALYTVILYLSYTNNVIINVIPHPAIVKSRDKTAVLIIWCFVNFSLGGFCFKAATASAYTLNHFKNSFQIYTISVGKRSGKYTKKFLLNFVNSYKIFFLTSF